MIDFVGFPGRDGIRSFFQLCSELPEIASNFEKLRKVIDFVGFPGYVENLVMSKISDIAGQPQILAIFWPEIE